MSISGMKQFCAILVFSAFTASVPIGNQILNDIFRRSVLELLNEDGNVSTLRLINRWGYSAESHDVITEDGYILTIFRIPRPRVADKIPKTVRPVVLIQHGLLQSSSNWVCNSPDHDAAFIFADAGYDVWLGNFRGNKHGRRHISLSPHSDKAKFWDFSWPEMANYDLPAIINFILYTTNSSNLYYMGHSMGALTIFAKLSEDQEFAKKVKKVYALAPAVKIDNAKGLAKLLAGYSADLNDVLPKMDVEEFDPATWSQKIGRDTCGKQGLVLETMCNNALHLIIGPSSHYVDRAKLSTYFSHGLSGTSRRTLVHFGQMVETGKMQGFDFGDGNVERYGKDTPPQYNISSIETPIALFWGSTDWLVTNEDIENVAYQLRNIFMKRYLQDFNHLDFLWGARAPQKIYYPIRNDIATDFDSNANSSRKNFLLRIADKVITFFGVKDFRIDFMLCTRGSYDNRILNLPMSLSYL